MSCALLQTETETGEIIDEIGKLLTSEAEYSRITDVNFPDIRDPNEQVPAVPLVYRYASNDLAQMQAEADVKAKNMRDLVVTMQELDMPVILDYKNGLRKVIFQKHGNQDQKRLLLRILPQYGDVLSTSKYYGNAMSGKAKSADSEFTYLVNLVRDGSDYYAVKTTLKLGETDTVDRMHGYPVDDIDVSKINHHPRPEVPGSQSANAPSGAGDVDSISIFDLFHSVKLGGYAQDVQTPQWYSRMTFAGEYGIEHGYQMPKVREKRGGGYYVEYSMGGTKYRMEGNDRLALEEQVKQLPQALENPLAVIESATHPDTSVVVLVGLQDAQGREIIAPMLVDGTAYHNNVEIDANIVTSLIGKKNALSKLVREAMQKEATGETAVYYIDPQRSHQLANVSGVQFPSQYVNGGYIHSIREEGSPVNLKLEDVTHTRQFKHWFGDWEASPETAFKVVDGDGKPLMVYHGTDADFSVFSHAYMSAHGSSEGQGFYFTDSQASIIRTRLKRRHLADCHVIISRRSATTPPSSSLHSIQMEPFEVLGVFSGVARGRARKRAAGVVALRQGPRLCSVIRPKKPGSDDTDLASREMAEGYRKKRRQFAARVPGHKETAIG